MVDSRFLDNVPRGTLGDSDKHYVFFGKRDENMLILGEKIK